MYLRVILLLSVCLFCSILPNIWPVSSVWEDHSFLWVCTLTGFKCCRAARNTHKTFLFFLFFFLSTQYGMSFKKNVLHVYAALLADFNLFKMFRKKLEEYLKHFPSKIPLAASWNKLWKACQTSLFSQSFFFQSAIWKCTTWQEEIYVFILSCRNFTICFQQCRQTISEQQIWAVNEIFHIKLDAFYPERLTVTEQEICTCRH